jgi:hypothetical protein
MLKRLVWLGLVPLALAATAVAGGAGPPQIRAENFVAGVDNPWFPLKPGTRWVYAGVKDGKSARDVVTVTHRTKPIQGVRCTVVDDRLYLRGRLAERTTDWYAQDRRGTVWYFGETTAELDARGKVTSRQGSWQSGRDGARAGIFMPAHPKIGQSYRQEFYEGQAEDHFQVLRVTERELLTKEWTPLEPGVIDHKRYVRGRGLVKEQTVKGGDERLVLVG